MQVEWLGPDICSPEKKEFCHGLAVAEKAEGDLPAQVQAINPNCRPTRAQVAII